MNGHVNKIGYSGTKGADKVVLSKLGCNSTATGLPLERSVRDAGIQQAGRPPPGAIGGGGHCWRSR